MFSIGYENIPNPRRQLTTHSLSTCIPNDSRASTRQSRGNCNCISRKAAKNCERRGLGGNRAGRLVSSVAGPRNGRGAWKAGVSPRRARRELPLQPHLTQRRKDAKNCKPQGLEGGGTRELVSSVVGPRNGTDRERNGYSQPVVPISRTTFLMCNRYDANSITINDHER